jgi:flagellar basal-body rod protein FlgF
MHKGIFIALSGATLKENQLEVISQNLANGNSLAYKKVKVAFKDYLSNPESERDGKIMSELAAQVTDFSEGNLTQTGKPLDLALEGNGFIALENNRFTRRGDFKRDAEGYLATQKGIRVLGPKGPIQIPEGKLDISPNGELTVNQMQFGTIKLVDFSDKSALDRVGDDMFQTNQTATPSKAAVKQGYLENSNVDIINQMVQIISTLREFQAYQKIIQSFDDASSKMNEVARI